MTELSRTHSTSDRRRYHATSHARLNIDAALDKIPSVTNEGFDLDRFATRAAIRYDIARGMIRCGLVLRGLFLLAEYGRQLTMLAEFANDEAVVL